MRTSEQETNKVFYVVLNVGSGRAETEQRCSTIKDVLERAGRACHLALVDDPSRLATIAADMAARAAASGRVLVAAGGDGTINAVAHEALRHGCTFGMLPQGTFNYFGRTNGVPEDLAGAVHALLHSKVRRVQIGMVNQRIFLVNASVGLYPRVLEEREHDKQQYGRSRLVALLSAIKMALRPHRRLHITLELDGKLRRLRVAIDSDTDALPLGRVRDHGDKEALARLAPEIQAAEAWAKEHGTDACAALISRFGGTRRELTYVRAIPAACLLYRYQAAVPDTQGAFFGVHHLRRQLSGSRS